MSNAPMTLEPAQALRRPQKRFSLPAAAALLASLAFFLLCAAYAGAPETVPEPQAAAAPARFAQLVPQGAGKVVSLALSGMGDAFVLQEQDGTLRLADEETALDPRAAGELLQTGASVIARQTLHGDPADYGVGDGALRAAYRYESGASFTLLLGDPVPTGEGWYAAAEGGEEIYVVNNALAATLRGGRQALYALPDLTQAFTANTLLSVSIERPGQETLALERVTQENPFNTKVQLTSPIRYPANAERAAEVYLALEKIRPSGVLAHADGEEIELLAVLTLRDRETTTLTIGRMGETFALRIGGADTLYAVGGDSLAFLDTLSVPYLAEQLPGLVMLNMTRRIDVRAGDETLSFTADPSADVYTLDGKALTREAFVPAYQQMIGLLIERYVPQPGVIGEARAVIEYTFADGQCWSITFARYDEQYDLVVRDGCARFLISREKTDAMLAALRSLK